MILLSASYTNIGPFTNNTIIVNFRPGKMLIQAPIGSGKSFLFFDGPLYGLYKSSKRNMLNNQSDQGRIEIVFEVQGTYYRIIRSLTRSKSGNDSCKTRLFKYKQDISSVNTQSIISTSSTSSYTIDNRSESKSDEIVLKNETDYQDIINQLLPPKEVFLATQMLLQDSENLFELQPNERLTIFKHIFDLIGIDHGKEIINKEKQQLYGQIKILQDTKEHSQQLQTLLQQLDRQLRQFPTVNENNTYAKQFHNTIMPLIEQNTSRAPLRDKILIEDFALPRSTKDIINQTESILQQRNTTYHTIKTQYNERTNQLQEKQQEIQTIEKEYSKIKQQHITIQKKVPMLGSTNKESDINKQLQDYTDQRDSLQNQQNLLNEEAEKTYIKLIHEKNKITTINELHEWIDNKIYEGKLLDAQLKEYELRVKNITMEAEQQHNTHIKELEYQYKNLETEYTHYQENINKNISDLDHVHTQIESLQKKMNENLHFSCPEIKKSCPFVKQINTNAYTTINDQIVQLQQQEITLTKEQKKIEQHIQQKQYPQQLKELQNKIITLKATSTNITHPEYQNVEKQHLKCKQDIDKVRQLLKNIKWQTWKKKFKIYQDLQQQKEELDRQIQSLHTKVDQQFQYQQELQTLTIQIESLEKQLSSQQQQQQTIEQEQQKFQKQIQLLHRSEYDLYHSTNKLLHQTLQKLSQLVEDQRHQQQKLQKIKERHTMINNLYKLFSQELVLLVLENSIPVLNDIMNTFLSQVINYEIDMEIQQEKGKTSLAINITDENGIREVKSLSGGQKVILKLCRMLAITAFTQSKMLLLDETINNLDSNTVSEVAEMLEDFTQQHDITLYVVTHSQQIQDMNIRDETITIGSHNIHKQYKS